MAQALVLGALHGPAELLPISSSGHVAVMPWLLGWDYCDADAEVRKAFEVALHAGTAAALLITLRTEVVRRRARHEPAIAELHRPLVRAAGDRRLHAGAPDRAPPRHARHDRRWAWWSGRWRWRGPTARRRRGPRTKPAWPTRLWLGVAQACALLPGVSRNGATLAAARRRGFAREDANQLSRHVALPVIAGATRAQDGAPGPARAAAAQRASVRARRGRVVRLDAGLARG